MASAIIYGTRTISGNQPEIRRVIEHSAQTFLLGTPVMLDATTGSIQAWDGTTVANGVAGITKENGANLTTTGVPKTITFGTVPNQPAAVNIPEGAPINDGRNGFETAVSDTVFHGQVGPAQTTVAADVGTKVGLTKDADNHWFADKTKNTSAAWMVQIVGLDQFDTRGVFFVFLPGAQQLLG